MQQRYSAQQNQLEKADIESIKKQFRDDNLKTQAVNIDEILQMLSKKHDYNQTEFIYNPSQLDVAKHSCQNPLPNHEYSIINKSQILLSFLEIQEKQLEQTSNKAEKSEEQIEQFIDIVNVTQDQKQELNSRLKSVSQMVKVALDLKKERIQDTDNKKEGSVNEIQKIEEQETSNIQQLQQIVESLQKQISQVIQIITDAQIDEKAEINRGFLELEQSNPQLYLYCKTFYWSSLNALNAYRAVGSGIIVGNHKSTMSKVVREKKEIISTMVKSGINNISNYTKGDAQIAKGVLKSIPVVDGLISGIDDVVSSVISAFNYTQNYKELSTFEQRVSSINKVIISKFSTEEQISLVLAKVAIKLAYLKKEKILAGQNPLLPNKFYPWFEEKITNLKQYAIKQVEISGNDEVIESVMLAVRDVALFISFIAVYSNEIVISKDDSIENQIIDIVENKMLDNLVKDKSKSLLKIEKKQKKKKKSNCNIF